jgi:hypothetical protein
VVYDYKNFSLQDIIMCFKQAIGSSKLTSVAIVAPGMTAGCVGESSLEVFLPLSSCQSSFATGCIRRRGLRR